MRLERLTTVLGPITGGPPAADPVIVIENPVRVPELPPPLFSTASLHLPKAFCPFEFDRGSLPRKGPRPASAGQKSENLLPAPSSKVVSTFCSDPQFRSNS